MRAINDQWTSEPSTQLILNMKEGAGGNMKMLESVVTIAEMDSVEYPESPMIKYFLASLYHELPEELSIEKRKQIELEKLRVEGREYILDMPIDTEEIIRNMGPEPTFTQSIQAASDYITRANSFIYLHMDNAKRAVHNLNDAIRRNEDNPKVYEDIFNITFLSLFLDDRTRPYLKSTAMMLF